MNCSGNIYRGSNRDDLKRLTQNGSVAPVDPNWGWTGKKTWDTAVAILEMEYGPKTAMAIASRLVVWLSIQPERGLLLTSEMLGVFVKEWTYEKRRLK
jgi:hypothetical protein